MSDPRIVAGRTTRMIVALVEAAKAGERVAISAHSVAYANELRRMAIRLGAPPDLVTIAPRGMRGHRPDYVIFDDHFYPEETA